MRTRTQTGVIETQKYDLLHQRLKGEGGMDEPIIRLKAKRAPRRGSKRSTWVKFPENMERSRRVFEHDIHRPDLLPDGQQRAPIFRSPVSIGADDNVPMSKIQRADTHVANMKLILEAHKQHMPEAVPVCQRNVWNAEAARAALEDNEENNAVFNKQGRRDIVKRRIDTLKRVLESSKFEDEKINIRCAINGYETGTIPYSPSYTIIWAGKIVDTAKTYAEFSADRMERLDRYQKSFGNGWLWYEAGLHLSPRDMPRRKLCATLDRIIRPDGLGHYYIQQGFKKVAGFVCRVPQPGDINLPKELTDRWLRNELGNWYCGLYGPKLSYTSLLDTGSSNPTLFARDFTELGIVDEHYAAQTCVEYHTANGLVVSRCYDMEVSVQDGTGEELVNPAAPVWPLMPFHLGSLMQVGVAIETQSQHAEGQATGERLSGMLPFVACYTSTYPTGDKFYLGEDRNDVLGADKCPGQRRWTHNLAPVDTAMVEWPAQLDNAKIVFSHNDGQVVDRDFAFGNGASELTINPGTQAQSVWLSNPSLFGGRMQAPQSVSQIREVMNEEKYHAAGNAILRLVENIHTRPNLSQAN